MRQTRGISPNWWSLEWRNWHRTWIVVSHVLVLAGSQWACGGSAESSNAGSGGSRTSSTSGGTDANASSGSGLGGGSADGATSTSTSTSGAVGTSSTGAGGAASGSSSTTSATSGSGGGPVCCNGLPTCPAGWTEVLLEGCPDGVECVTVELCCESVTCMPRFDVICDAVPVCDAGDIDVAECPADASCYTNSLCGSTITCQDAECFPDQEPNKSYAGLGSICNVIDFGCSEGTTSFYDECGCGCEQAESCPEFVDCEPGGELDPLCTDLTTCPLTERAE